MNLKTSLLNELKNISRNTILYSNFTNALYNNLATVIYFLTENSKFWIKYSRKIHKTVINLFKKNKNIN